MKGSATTSFILSYIGRISGSGSGGGGKSISGWLFENGIKGTWCCCGETIDWITHGFGFGVECISMCCVCLVVVMGVVVLLLCNARVNSEREHDVRRIENETNSKDGHDR